MRVVVRDIDDNAPAFPAARANLTLGVRLNVPVDTSLVTLEAEDADADSAPMRYWLSATAFQPLLESRAAFSHTPEQVKSVFRLDESTGELRTAQGMQQFVDGYFTLQVAATNTPDGNTTTKRANATVKVRSAQQEQVGSPIRSIANLTEPHMSAGVRRSRPRPAQVRVHQAAVRRATLAARVPAPGGKGPAAPGAAQRVRHAVLLQAGWQPRLQQHKASLASPGPPALAFPALGRYPLKDTPFTKLSVPSSSCFQLVGRENYDLSDMESLLMDKNNDELNSVYDRFHVRAVQVSVDVEWSYLVVVVWVAYPPGSM